MNQNDPLSKLAAMTAAQDSKRAAERARVRAICPQLTAVMDELGANGRMRCIWVDGKVVAGKPPEDDDTVSISGDFYLMACRMGAKK